MEVVRYVDRPDLRSVRHSALAAKTFAEYLHHNEVANRLWPRLYDAFPDFQLALVDGDDLVAELHGAPLAWDGTLADLPVGWEDGIERSFATGEPNTLHALAISVDPDRQGEGLGARMLAEMRAVGQRHGLPALIACVRPTRKADYPLVPIERYAEWRRADGSHFDPWLRLHERAGGRIVAVSPESFTLAAPASEWEQWTGLELPEDGDYVVPGMLAPLVVEGGTGRHAEPNVWVVHDS
jgi:ribosomal protein S18 acetylase RimI-like enzyme